MFRNRPKRDTVYCKYKMKMYKCYAPSPRKRQNCDGGTRVRAATAIGTPLRFLRKDFPKVTEMAELLRLQLRLCSRNNSRSDFIPDR